MVESVAGLLPCPAPCALFSFYLPSTCPHITREAVLRSSDYKIHLHPGAATTPQASVPRSQRLEQILHLIAVHQPEDEHFRPSR